VIKLLFVVDVAEEEQSFDLESPV